MKKYLIIPLVALALLFSGFAPVQAALTDDLLAYYKLDESSGSAADASGAGNTLTNNNSVTYAAAKINNGAVGTNTTNGYLGIASALGYTAAANRTWNFWVKPNSLNGYLLDNITAAGDADRLIIYGGSTVVHIFINGNTVSSSALTGGTFSMITVKKTGTTYELFLNTVSQGSTSPGGATYSGGVGFNLLNSLYTGGTMTNDTIDEVGIWNRALTSGELTSLYNGGAGLAYPFSTPSAAVPIFFQFD